MADQNTSDYTKISEPRYKYEDTQPPITRRDKRFWTRKRLLALALAITCAIVVLIISLTAVFVPRRANTLSVPPSGNQSTVWQPKTGATWNYQINGALPANHTGKYDVWDIDLFDNPASTIASLHQKGSSVICYFSAGSYEDWRADAKNFTESDLGSPLGNWPGENWLNTSTSNVRKIMLARMDVAVQKGCDGVDPDNMDGYNNDNGLNLTAQNSIDYVNFLADAAHARNLSMGLKNAGEIVPQVVHKVQYSVNEACVTYNECAIFDPFIDLKKPVFHVEYPKGFGINNYDAIDATNKTMVCKAQGAGKFSTIMKNQNLDGWIEVC